MPLPDFQSIMLPLLQIAIDGEDHYLAMHMSAITSCRLTLLLVGV
jgi:hypothetical protein